mgnify:CR=1 FL=1
MGLVINDVSLSRAMKVSLKRGLARQALSQAVKVDADSGRIMTSLQQLRPNRVAMERKVVKLRAVAGVVRAGISRDQIVIILRNVRDVVMKTEAQELFQERALIYSRLTASAGNRSIRLAVHRASFCLHSLERFIERSSLSVNAPLLPAVDAEAAHLLTLLSSRELIADNGDHYGTAKHDGVWAGSEDTSRAESEWGFCDPTGSLSIPIFSARTFLGPDEMRPLIYLHWKNDADGSIAKK